MYIKDKIIIYSKSYTILIILKLSKLMKYIFLYTFQKSRNKKLIKNIFKVKFLKCYDFLKIETVIFFCKKF